MWVPALFGADAVARSSAEQGYRVSSEALGRDLEEDLSLHPAGCKDWGLHDQNDARDGKRSPIDVVMQWSERFGARLEDGETPTTALQAARWLAARLGIDLDELRKASNAARVAEFLAESEGEAAFLPESDGAEFDVEGDAAEAPRQGGGASPPIPTMRTTDESGDDTAEEVALPGVTAGRRTRGRAGEGVSLDDFHAYMPTHSYIFAPTREMWPGSSVNSRIPAIPLVKKNGEPLIDEDGKQKKAKATAWLDRCRPIEQATWAPGEPMLILAPENGTVQRSGFSRPCPSSARMAGTGS